MFFLLHLALSVLVAADELGWCDQDGSCPGVFLVQTDRRAVKAGSLTKQTSQRQDENASLRDSGGAQTAHVLERLQEAHAFDRLKALDIEEKLPAWMPWLFRNSSTYQAAHPRLQLSRAGYDFQTLPMESLADGVTIAHGGMPPSSNWKLAVFTPITLAAAYLVLTRLKAQRTRQRSGTPARFDPSAIYLMCLIASMGNSMIIVLKPYIALTLGASPGMVGVLQSAFSFSQFFGTLIMGWMSDKFGRKQLLLVLPIGHIVAHLGSAMSTTYWPFFFSRLLLGCFGGLVPISEALIAENVPKEECAGALGKLMACLGLGAVAGPAMASLLSPLGFANIFYFAAVLALAIWMWLLWSFDDSWKGAAPAAEQTLMSERQDGTESKQTSVRYGMLLFWYAICLFGATFGTTSQSMIPLIYLDWYGITERKMGILFMLAGVVGMLTQATFTGPLSKRFGNLGTATMGAFGGVLIMAFFLSVRHPVVPWIVGVGGPALGALTDPTSCAAVAQLAGDTNRGKLLGIYQALRALGQGLGPVIGGFLYEISVTLPFRVSYIYSMCSCAFMAGVLYAVKPDAEPETPLEVQRENSDGSPTRNSDDSKTVKDVNC